MKLENDVQLKNTRWKLSLLENLLREKNADPNPGPAHDASVQSLEQLAQKLRKEIEEYETQSAAGMSTGRLN